jgi:hypothetical protein
MNDMDKVFDVLIAGAGASDESIFKKYRQVKTAAAGRAIAAFRAMKYLRSIN